MTRPSPGHLDDESNAIEARTIDLDFVVVGGGILGTAVAALASQAGYRVLVLRLHDRGVPRADTLRNQGWLQSGLLYRLEDFSDETEYRNIARMTYFRGRDMLKDCDMTPSMERGVLRVVQKDRVAEMERKANLLRLSTADFRRLEGGEAQDRLADLYERNSIYFTLPDAPFDEAGVLQYLRSLATRNGAEFVQLNGPVRLEPSGNATRILWAQTALESPLTLVAAGAGSLTLMEQIGHHPSALLRRTPLLVHSGTCGINVPILVDLDRAFSAVRHTGNSVPAGAVVIGTKVRKQPAEFARPEDRRVPPDERARFEGCLHPQLRPYIHTGRFTAGYEVMPTPPAKTSFVEPWVEDYGSVVFASPGRATLGLEGARKALAVLAGKISARQGQTFQYRSSAKSTRWDDDIHMHFSDHYGFNDAEN